ncbi:alpha/beta fold hydrolase [Endozoicomonas sp. SM1973]|uniref:Alpha/beta fold hydrolase n=1 Tax=Spartinivicinus marinus TaxID=2994442 RepID=A0A853HRK3_9GAMM|nr:alpha/beta fold hydrolase [Spartinivicinus marinus]MCX4026594.1 alpha/beta fold hydrolase [Spartinivicinus marinus]NYZ64430.1 alpha/beta fold hydrolase [Spartinivicinus marinus]
MPYVTIKSRQIHYQDHGTGFPILFGHSYLWDSNMWKPQIEELSKSYRCIVPDLWSHGLSDSPANSPYSIAQMAEDYWLLTKELGLEHFAIVGLSVGGMWGCQLALSHPEAVAALVMMDTFVGEEPEETHNRYFGMLDMVDQVGAIPPPLQESIIPLFFASNTIQNNPELVSQFKSDLTTLPTEQIPGVVGIGRGIFSRSSLLSQLNQISMPILIVVGEEDNARPPHEAKQMAEMIPQAQLEVIENAGHISNLEQPTQVNKLLSQFLSTAIGTRK